MGINAKLQEVRAYPVRKSITVDLLISFGVILLGALLGYIAKASDSISFIGDLGTELGVWVFIAALVAVYSRYPYTAAINIMLFFLSMLASYYLYGQLVLGFFPKAYFMGWLVISILSPFAGFLIWFAKGKGYIGAIASALPISVLFAWGYPFFYTRRPVLLFTLCFGVILCILLPKTLYQKAGAFGLSILFAFIIVQLKLISYLPW